MCLHQQIVQKVLLILKGKDVATKMEIKQFVNSAAQLNPGPDPEFNRIRKRCNNFGKHSSLHA